MGLMPQKLGQHFLKNNAVIERIIEGLDLAPGDSVIEIGPGRGALTLPLAKACAAKGIPFQVIEKDAGLIALLGKKMGDSAPIVHRGDALKILPRLLKEYPTAKIVGNIPYYITGKLLRTLSETDPAPSLTILMIQREVADRILALPPDMNRLGAVTQLWAVPERILNVSRESFSPPPQVESTIIALRKRDKRAANAFSVAHALFQQPRKTLLNNLEALVKQKNKDELRNELESLGIASTIRPQDLSVEDIIAITEKFSSRS